LDMIQTGAQVLALGIQDVFTPLIEDACKNIFSLSVTLDKKTEDMIIKNAVLAGIKQEYQDAIMKRDRLALREELNNEFAKIVNNIQLTEQERKAGMLWLLPVEKEQAIYRHLDAWVEELRQDHLKSQVAEHNQEPKTIKDRMISMLSLGEEELPAVQKA